MNGEDVQLIPVPNAHTDDDTMVYFPTADVLMVGDFYRSIQYPNVDRNNGGTVKGVVDGLNAVIAVAKPTTKIVPGHGPVVDKTAVAANRDMILTIRDCVSALISGEVAGRGCRQTSRRPRRACAAGRNHRRSLSGPALRRPQSRKVAG
jgi:glyoxylase-like metal-dependent hydrolase (beta-lactamase superfamily II)